MIVQENWAEFKTEEGPCQAPRTKRHEPRKTVLIVVVRGSWIVDRGSYTSAFSPRSRVRMRTTS